MNIFMFCGFSVISVILVVILRKMSPELTPTVSVIAVGIAMVYIIKDSSGLFSKIYELTEKSGIDSNNIKIMFNHNMSLMLFKCYFFYYFNVLYFIFLAFFNLSILEL